MFMNDINMPESVDMDNGNGKDFVSLFYPFHPASGLYPSRTTTQRSE